jgi:hypothetical protein
MLFAHECVTLMSKLTAISLSVLYICSARRPSVQNLVASSVKEALRHHTSENDKAPEGSDRSRHSVSRSPDAPAASRSKPASRRTTAEAPLNVGHHLHPSSAAASKSASPTPKLETQTSPPPPHPQPFFQPLGQTVAPGFMFDPIAAAAVAGAEAAIAADRRARSLSREHRRRRHHHHHHHHSAERDGYSPRDGSRIHTMSPPPTMPPLTQQPFQMPTNFAHFMQSMHAQQQHVARSAPVPAPQTDVAASQSQAPSQRSAVSHSTGPAAGRPKARPAVTGSTSTKSSGRKSISGSASAVVAAASAAPVLSRKPSMSSVDTGRDSLASRVSAPPSKPAHTVIPPLPLHKVKGLREEATEVVSVIHTHVTLLMYYYA